MGPSPTTTIFMPQSGNSLCKRVYSPRAATRFFSRARRPTTPNTTSSRQTPHDWRREASLLAGLNRTASTPRPMTERRSNPIPSSVRRISSVGTTVIPALLWSLRR